MDLIRVCSTPTLDAALGGMGALEGVVPFFRPYPLSPDSVDPAARAA